MSQSIRFLDEFKQHAVAEVFERGYAVSAVAVRLGIKSLDMWKAQFAKSPPVRELTAEIKRLKCELARLAEERTVLKRRPLHRPAGHCRAMSREGRLTAQSFRCGQCSRVVAVHFSGFHAWLKEPLSQRALEYAWQTDLIHQAWADNGKVYGYCKLADYLLDRDEIGSENRLARLAGLAGNAAQIGYKCRAGRDGYKPAVVADNTLDQQCAADAPDTVGVTDITYIKAHEGGSYLAVIINLFSRSVVGW